MVDTCVRCGEVVPEGAMVCINCYNKVMNDGQSKRLKKFAKEYESVEKESKKQWGTPWLKGKF